MTKNRIERKVLLGLGFDCEDGHVRITKGDNFRLYGGSIETHELMQEKAIKFNECLGKRGKKMDDIDVKEFHEIAHKVGLKVPGSKKKKKKGEKGHGKHNG